MNLEKRIMEIIQKSFTVGNTPSDRATEKSNGSEWKVVLEDEVHQLEKDVAGKLLVLAEKVYSVLIDEEQEIVGRNTKGIMEILLQIKYMNKAITEKELLLTSGVRSGR
jgi:hypothetical protein